MKREILNLKEYDLIPLIDEYWDEREEYWEVDENEDPNENENGNYIIKSGEWNNFKLITSDLDYYDLEDGYEVIINIIQRISDGKYFSFKHTWSPYNSYNIRFNSKVIEVFPKEKIITVYE